jgi:hypothetical protein
MAVPWQSPPTLRGMMQSSNPRHGGVELYSINAFQLSIDACADVPALSDCWRRGWSDIARTRVERLHYLTAPSLSGRARHDFKSITIFNIAPASVQSFSNFCPCLRFVLHSWLDGCREAEQSLGTANPRNGQKCHFPIGYPALSLSIPSTCSSPQKFSLPSTGSYNKAQLVDVSPTYPLFLFQIPIDLKTRSSARDKFPRGLKSV